MASSQRPPRHARSLSTKGGNDRNKSPHSSELSCVDPAVPIVTDLTGLATGLAHQWSSGRLLRRFPALAGPYNQIGGVRLRSNWLRSNWGGLRRRSKTRSARSPTGTVSTMAPPPPASGLQFGDWHERLMNHVSFGSAAADAFETTAATKPWMSGRRGKPISRPSPFFRRSQLSITHALQERIGS